MNLLRNLFVSVGSIALAIGGWLFFSGCASPKGNSISNDGESTVGVKPDIIRISEQLTIEFLDINPNQQIQQTVQDDGTITLLLGQRVRAADKKISALVNEIHDIYVPKYYKRLTVNIKRENRFYFVGGYVRNASQRAYTGDMTVIRAIKSAGDFTEFADKRKVKVIRSNGVTEIVDCIEALKDPKLDLPVYPGDTIDVPLSWR